MVYIMEFILFCHYKFCICYFSEKIVNTSTRSEFVPSISRFNVPCVLGSFLVLSIHDQRYGFVCFGAKVF